MKNTLTFILLFVCSSFLNISITSACTTTTSSNWTVSDCVVPSTNTTTVVNTSKSWNWPSPYITRVENTTLWKTNWWKRVFCPGSRSINTSGSSFSSSCSATPIVTPTPSCTTTQSWWWLISNCAVPSTYTTTVIDENKSWDWPSPYITTISNTTLWNISWWKRYYCSWRRAIDTTGWKYYSSCNSTGTPPPPPVTTCSTTTSDNWTVSNCALNSNNTTTVINTKKSWNWPSPYITSIENTSLGKSNWWKRVYCPGARSVDTTNSNFINTCSTTPTLPPTNCQTTTSELWTVSDCAVPSSVTTTVINTKKSWNWPSPYITNVENTSLWKSNNWKWVYCLWPRSIDTTGSNFISTCSSPVNSYFRKDITFSPISNWFVATWDNDNNVSMHSYFLKKDNSNDIIRSWQVTSNSLTIEWLTQWSSYYLQVIARNAELKPIWEYNWKITTAYSKTGALYFPYIGDKWVRVYWDNNISNATRYKLDIFSAWDNVLVSSSDYKSNIPDTNCLLSSNTGKLKGCSMTNLDEWGNSKLRYSTEYKATLTAYDWNTILSTLEWTFTTSYESAGLTFSDIKFNWFIFSWDGRAWVSNNYYDIYDQTNSKKIISWMYDDRITNSYNTITWKYKNFTWFPLVYNTKYLIKVHWYSDAVKRDLVVYSWEVTTDWDDIHIISSGSKLQMEKLLPKIKTINLSDWTKYTNLISYLATFINWIDLSTDIWKSYKIKATYLKELLENLIQKREYFTLISNPSVTFQDIATDWFTIKRNKASSNPSKYYIKIDDITNNRNLINWMYEDTLTYSYNTKTWKYKSSYKIESCTLYKIEVSYSNWWTSYITNKSTVVTKWCEDINTLVTNDIKWLVIWTTWTPSPTVTPVVTTVYNILLTDNVKAKLDKIVSDYIVKIQDTSTKNTKINEKVIKLEILKVQFDEYANILQYLIDRLNQNKN